MHLHTHAFIVISKGILFLYNSWKCVGVGKHGRVFICRKIVSTEHVVTIQQIASEPIEIWLVWKQSLLFHLR